MNTPHASLARLTAALFPVLAVAFAFAGSANAATIFGNPLTYASPADDTTDLSYVAAFNADGSDDAGSPIAGVITSVRVRSTGDAGTETVTLQRRIGPWDTGVGTFLKLADVPVNVAADPTSAGHITQVQARVPVNAGDVLGLEHPAGNDGVKLFEIPTTVLSDTCAYYPGVGQPVGLTWQFSLPGCGKWLVLEQATVEPDADHDGYGDETQDLCPNDAAIHTACPTPADLSIAALKSKVKAKRSATRSFMIKNTGQKPAGATTFRVKSSKRVKGLKIVKGCRPSNAKKPTSCSIPGIAPGASVTITVSMKLKSSTKTTLKATVALGGETTPSNNSAKSTVTFKPKKK